MNSEEEKWDMKRLINDGYEVVEEMLEGYAAANKQYVTLDLEIV